MPPSAPPASSDTTTTIAALAARATGGAVQLALDSAYALLSRQFWPASSVVQPSPAASSSLDAPPRDHFDSAAADQYHHPAHTRHTTRESSPPLAHLQLSGPLGQFASAFLRKALSACTSLTELSLCCTSTSPLLAASIFGAVPFPNLQRLRLTRCVIELELVDSLATNCTSLTCIELRRCNQLDDPSVEQLTFLTSLRELALVGLVAPVSSLQLQHSSLHVCAMGVMRMA